MAHEFNTQLTAQREWGWLLALDLFFSGLGGGLFLLFFVFNLPPFVAVVSLGLVALGTLVLMIELGRPLRAWRALCRPSSSWISRGVLFVTCFFIFGGLFSAPAFESLSWAAPASDAAHRAIGSVAAVSALLVTIYPGFVLAASPSIPFWNSPLLPVLFSLNSLMAATGLVMLLAPLGMEHVGLGTITVLGGILMVVNLILGAMYLGTSNSSGVAGKEAVKRLREGSLGRTFTFGAVLLGMVVPLFVVLWAPSAIALAGLLLLIGGLLFRYCVLRAGVYVPFPLT